MATAMVEAPEPVNLDTQHEDMIHDAQVDYYSKRLATCSSDQSIRVFDIDGSRQNLVDILKGHEGPVWQVAWAHPKFGTILASCGYDARVIIWQQENESRFQNIHEYRKHSSSVNSVAFAPHEHGLMLACGSSDGRVSILMYNFEDGSWHEEMFAAHPIGCNSVSWAPLASTNLLSINAEINRKRAANFECRLATGGCDNMVKIWKWNQKWELEKTLEGHEDWVRDVSWAPNIGLPVQYLASGSQDRNVLIWTEENGEWKTTPLKPDRFADVIWRVSWSLSGTVLAVASGDNRISIWREGHEGDWKCISDLQEAHPPAQQLQTQQQQPQQPAQQQPPAQQGYQTQQSFGQRPPYVGAAPPAQPAPIPAVNTQAAPPRPGQVNQPYGQQQAPPLAGGMQYGQQPPQMSAPPMGAPPMGAPPMAGPPTQRTQPPTAFGQQAQQYGQTASVPPPPRPGQTPPTYGAVPGQPQGAPPSGPPVAGGMYGGAAPPRMGAPPQGPPPTGSMSRPTGYY